MTDGATGSQDAAPTTTAATSSPGETGPDLGALGTQSPADGPARARTAGQRTRAGLAGDLLNRYYLILVWIAIVIVFGILQPDTFLTSANAETIFGTQAVQAVISLALVMPTIAGEFDLSIAATAGLSAMIVGVLNGLHHWGLLPSMLVALAAGIVVGCVNAFTVVFCRVNSFIATLGSQTVIAGVILWISHSNTIGGISQDLIDNVITKRWFEISLEFYYALAICIIIWYFIRYIPIGRQMLYTGQAIEVARLSGIRVDRVRALALIGAGFVSAIAGLLYAGTSGAADPTSWSAFLLPAFAAVFLGSTAINPGYFNAWGTLIAVFFLVTGSSGLQLMGAQPYVQNLFYGGVLLVAVSARQLLTRRSPA